MAKTKYELSILAISIVLIAGSLAVSPIAIADDDDEEKETPLLFVWDPAETSSDPDNLITVSGSFTRVGLTSDTTSDVSGEIEGELEGQTDNESTTIQETIVGSTTITTTVNAHSDKADHLEGVIFIDGEGFVVDLEATSVATILEVTDEFTSPELDQSATLKKLTIPVEVEMNHDDVTIFEGFGVIRLESNRVEAGGSVITFTTTTLEAELIGDTGFFVLQMTHFQRTVEVISP